MVAEPKSSMAMPSGINIPVPGMFVAPKEPMPGMPMAGMPQMFGPPPRNVRVKRTAEPEASASSGINQDPAMMARWQQMADMQAYMANM